jgi:hypothetical protein
MGIFRPRGVRTFFFVFVSIKVPTVEEQHCGNKPRIAISKFQKHIAAKIAAIAIYPSISVTSFVGAGQIQVYLPVFYSITWLPDMQEQSRRDDRRD